MKNTRCGTGIYPYAAHCLHCLSVFKGGGRDFGVCGFRKPSPTTRSSCSRWWEGEAFVGKFHYQHTHCFAHSMSYPPLARTTTVLVTDRRPKRSDVMWGSVLVHPWAPGLFWGETEKKQFSVATLSHPFSTKRPILLLCWLFIRPAVWKELFFFRWVGSLLICSYVVMGRQHLHLQSRTNGRHQGSFREREQKLPWQL